MYDAVADPYCYPGTTVLRNIPSIRDQAALERFETTNARTKPLLFSRSCAEDAGSVRYYSRSASLAHICSATINGGDAYLKITPTQSVQNFFQYKASFTNNIFGPICIEKLVWMLPQARI